MQENQKRPLTVNCPTCKTPVEWKDDNKFRPFCSERCQLIDLGAWAAEEYRVPDQSSLIPDEFEDDPSLY